MSRRPRLTAPLRRPEVSYPLRDLELVCKQIIIQALRSAWERILGQMALDGGNLCAEPEPAITSRLEIALNTILGEPGHPSGFSGSLFQDVVRGAEIPNYNSQSLEKRPDLTFRLISIQPGLDRSLYALFVECKIVGPSHSVDEYCGHGILRFVAGDYAWAMPCGMMLAYAHPGFTVSDLLAYFRRTTPQTRELRILHPPRPSRDLSGDPQVYESSHGRTWVYPGRDHGAGDLCLLHLWLPLP
jgi:hypothetical protein